MLATMQCMTNHSLISANVQVYMLFYFLMMAQAIAKSHIAKLFKNICISIISFCESKSTFV
jgi:hypothetical protein